MRATGSSCWTEGDLYTYDRIRKAPSFVGSMHSATNCVLWVPDPVVAVSVVVAVVEGEGGVTCPSFLGSCLLSAEELTVVPTALGPMTDADRLAERSRSNR